MLKRRSPPWGAIEAFIVASRRAASFKDAASQLALSPAAFSRRIQMLEEHVGVKLFNRMGQTPTLTAAGERYLQRLEPSYEAMRAATEWMAPDAERRALRLGVSQSFAVSWLVPRLPDFYQKTRGIELVIQTCADSVDLAGGAADLRILYGHGDWPNFTSQKLFDLQAFVVSAPVLMGGIPTPRSIEDLQDVPLLELIHPRNQWSEWLSQAGYTAPLREPRYFDSAQVMYEAASQGLGVALGVSPLVDSFLKNGRLQIAFDSTQSLSGAYHLAALPEVRRHPAVQILWHWLINDPSCIVFSELKNLAS